MKATYQKPSIEVMNIELQSIMAGSLRSDGNSGNTQGAVGGGDAGGAAGNQGFSIWKDDEEE